MVAEDWVVGCAGSRVGVVASSPPPQADAEMRIPMAMRVAMRVAVRRGERRDGRGVIEGSFLFPVPMVE
ncbi:MAG: hypothetical protein LC118_03425 [Dehalococcoidia bacterium]|nr:hypothetical protein [Dehalococcoidia bacterium]